MKAGATTTTYKKRHHKRSIQSLGRPLIYEYSVGLTPRQYILLSKNKTSANVCVGWTWKKQTVLFHLRRSPTTYMPKYHETQAINIFDSSRRLGFLENRLCFSCGQKLVRNTASFNIGCGERRVGRLEAHSLFSLSIVSFSLWFVFSFLFFVDWITALLFTFAFISGILSAATTTEKRGPAKLNAIENKQLNKLRFGVEIRPSH